METEKYIKVGGVLTQKQIEDLFDKITLPHIKNHKRIYCNSNHIKDLCWVLKYNQISGYDSEFNLKNSHYATYEEKDLKPFLSLINKDSTKNTEIKIDILVNGEEVHLSDELIEKILNHYYSDK